MIARTTNCKDDDVVIFAGSGVSGALQKLIQVLNFNPERPPVS
jgi:hypothetical protein